MPMPKPGRPVRGSRTGRPIMALLDLAGHRWVLRIIWELRAETLGFREVQRRCDAMSPSVLSQRLRALGDAGIVQGVDGGIGSTEEGQELPNVLAPLRAWAIRWAQRTGDRARANLEPEGRRGPGRDSLRRSPGPSRP